jgi:hypothetical protein
MLDVYFAAVNDLPRKKQGDGGRRMKLWYTSIMALKDTTNQIKIRKRADFYLLFTVGCYILILTPKRAAIV